MPEHLWQTTSINLFKRSLKRFCSGRYRALHIRDILFNGLYTFTYLLTSLLTYETLNFIDRTIGQWRRRLECVVQQLYLLGWSRVYFF